MFDLPTVMLAAVFATFLAAGLVKGVTGMGLPTVAMGMLGALISPLVAASLLIVPSFATNVWQLFAGPSFGALLRRLWPMMLAVVVGTLLGSRWIASGDTGVTTLLLGIALIIYSRYHSGRTAGGDHHHACHRRTKNERPKSAIARDLPMTAIVPRSR